MSRNLAVTVDNDFLVDATGNFVILEGLSSVMGACASIAKAQRGEMIRAVSQGIPNFQVVWVGNPNLSQFESALRAAWAKVSGVLRVLEFEASQERDVLKYHAVIETTFGIATLTETGVFNGL